MYRNSQYRNFKCTRGMNTKALCSAKLKKEMWLRFDFTPCHPLSGQKYSLDCIHPGSLPVRVCRLFSFPVQNVFTRSFPFPTHYQILRECPFLEMGADVSATSQQCVLKIKYPFLYRAKSVSWHFTLFTDFSHLKHKTSSVSQELNVVI